MIEAGSVNRRGRLTAEYTPIVGTVRAKTAGWGARLCLVCGERRARFFYRGTVKADRDHNLCFECFRAESNRLRARRLSPTAAWVPLAGLRPVSSRMVADRAALLADLHARRRRAQMMARRAVDAAEAAATRQTAEALAS